MKNTTLWIGALVTVGIGACLGVWFWPRPQLNLLLITLDTTRADHIGCYGSKDALTPTLDGLAANGVLFEKAYAPAPMTLPSHATILTGLYPPEHGLHLNGRNRLSPHVPTLTERLSARGYETAAFVSSIVLDSKYGLERGFQVYDDQCQGEVLAAGVAPQRTGDATVEAALVWLKDRKDAPFFCWIHLYDPHEPRISHEAEFGTRFDAQPYDGEIAFADLQLRKLTTFLKGSTFAGRTLIVVAGDHGEGLGEHGEHSHAHTLYNSVLHVPLIFSLPGVFASSHRVSSPVSLVDVYPTIADCLRLSDKVAAANRHSASGLSLKPALLGNPIEPHECYAETDQPYIAMNCAPLRSLSNESWKYVRTPRPELYNLIDDSGETFNLAATHDGQLQLMESLLVEQERRMSTHADALPAKLSAAEERALSSLGYAGESAQNTNERPPQTLPDVKDLLPYWEALEDARKLLAEGAVDPAIEILHRVIDAVPGFSAARILLGNAHEQAGKLDDAAATYEQILKMDPECHRVLSYLGHVLALQGQLEKAVVLFSAFLKIDPDSSDTQHRLGTVLSQLGRLDEAREHLNESLKIDPTNAFAHVTLGKVFRDQGKPDQAAQQYRMALEIDPKSIDAHYNLGLLYAGQGRHANALPHFLRAVELDPHDADAQHNLGAALLHQKRFDEAILHYTVALRLQPDNQEFQRSLRHAHAKLSGSN